MTTPPIPLIPERFLILLVDDLPANLHLLAEILRDEYRIKTTTSGTDALKLAARGPQPDLVVLDVMMPDLNGIEVLRRLRANQQTCDIPVIFVSADSSEQTQLNGLDIGADDYLVKPVQPLILLARVRNLLRRKKAEEALDQLNRELERKVDERTQELVAALNRAKAASVAKSQFLSTMSHELFTPMNGFTGMVQICLDSEHDAEKRHYLETALQEAKLLQGMISDILNFSLVEAGNLVTETVPFSVREVLDKLAVAYEVKAKNKGLTLGIEVVNAIPTTLLGDPLCLGQVLHNLVDNAVKFTRSGTVGVRAEVAAVEEQFVVLRFSVCDTGIGMSDELLSQLFQPFTADMSTTRRFGGIGLGLSISRLLVELMGGKIQVSSTFGEGTDVSFTARCSRQEEIRHSGA